MTIDDPVAVRRAMRPHASRLVEQALDAAISVIERRAGRGHAIDDQGLLSGADNDDFDSKHGREHITIRGT
jgi:hypothetical protein